MHLLHQLPIVCDALDDLLLPGDCVIRAVLAVDVVDPGYLSPGARLCQAVVGVGVIPAEDVLWLVLCVSAPDGRLKDPGQVVRHQLGGGLAQLTL